MTFAVVMVTLCAVALIAWFHPGAKGDGSRSNRGAAPRMKIGFNLGETGKMGNLDSRHSIRDPDAGEESGVHDHRGAHAGAWNWRKHGNFQRREQRDAESAAVSHSRPGSFRCTAKCLASEHGSVPYLSFQDWQKQNRTTEAMASYREDNCNLMGMGEAERVPVGQVSADFFKVLGGNPMMGRLFNADEDRLGASPVIVLGEGFWKRKFGGAPDVLGKTILLNGTDYTVIGVVRDNFKIFTDGQVYVPIGQWNDPTFRDRTMGRGMDVVARLRPGVSVEKRERTWILWRESRPLTIRNRMAAWASQQFPCCRIWWVTASRSF